MNIFSLIRQRAELNPAQVAYHRFGDPVGPLTYAELVGRSEARAEAFRRAGASPGERFGLCVPEGADFLVSALGSLAAGLCMVPVAPSLPLAEQERLALAAALHGTIRAGGALSRHGRSGAAVDGQNDVRFRAVGPAYIRFTSGTTGRRKGVLLGHQTIAERLRCADARLRIGPGDRIWFQLPMADHFVVSVLLYLTRGATVLTAPAGQPETWPGFVRAAAPTLLYGSPEFHAALTDSLVETLPEVRLAISTTSRLPHKVQRQFAAKFGRPLNAALGIIEAGLLTLDERSGRPGSVGRILPAYQATIADAQAAPVPPGTLGELHVAGPGLLDAYLDPWRPRELLLGPLGFPTGDFGRLDAEGNLYLAGRGRSRIALGDTVFFAEEVEDVLDALPGIAESRVYLDAATGQLAAEVVPESGETVPAFVRTTEFPDPRMAPRIVSAVRALARTANGKLLRAGS